MADKFKEKATKMLLVEGINDCFVIANLCTYFKVGKTFKIYDCEGSDSALKMLSSLIYSSEPMETIALVLDADEPDLLGRWSAVKGKLQSKGIVLPERPNISGTIIPATEESPRIGLWLMPDNQADGMLEDFCSKLATPDALLFAQECVEKAQDKRLTRFNQKHKSKSIIHTYLAWQEDPGKPLGQAITAGTLNPQHPIATNFMDWINKLFNS